MVPMAWPTTNKGPVTDSLKKKQPRLSKSKIGSQTDATNANTESEKENPSKSQEQTIPSWDSFPPIIDDGAKPQSSYAQLIGMAILRSPQRRLTLSQIYKWISEHYSFYAPTDAGWQNSIRHNLSLHKSFIKIERSKDDPGKGNYWGIEPGNEHLFLKEKPSRKCVPTAENMPVMSARMEPSQPAVSIIMPEPTLPPLLPLQRHSDPNAILPEPILEAVGVAIAQA
ncbi:Forkhead protein sep1 [Escovopsis weberi]|uniref:Forkhead protein sep1 n=1 Tax=Escovopsis weberi TaxID=150374 RepID=A0A0M8N2A4_ESCWE|nr:Forkhead protein sep1 [Escovopsis weberi]